MSKEKLSNTDAIIDWFERNPNAKARSGPLAKALKRDSTQIAAALAYLAEKKTLGRLLVKVKDAERGVGLKEQWEYWKPLGGTVATPAKQYTPAKAVRRSDVAASLPTINAVAAPPQTETEQPKLAEEPAMLNVQPTIACTQADLAELKHWRDICAVNDWKTPDDLIKHLAELDDKLVESAREQQEISRLLDLSNSELTKSLNKLTDARTETAEAIQAQINAEEFSKIHQDLIADLKASLEKATAGPFVVPVPGKPMIRFKKREKAEAAALSLARAGKRINVFGLIPIGKAIPGAEWRKQA